MLDAECLLNNEENENRINLKSPNNYKTLKNNILRLKHGGITKSCCRGRRRENSFLYLKSWQDR